MQGRSFQRVSLGRCFLCLSCTLNYYCIFLNSVLLMSFDTDFIWCCCYVHFFCVLYLTDHDSGFFVLRVLTLRCLFVSCAFFLLFPLYFCPLLQDLVNLYIQHITHQPTAIACNQNKTAEGSSKHCNPIEKVIYKYEICDAAQCLHCDPFIPETWLHDSQEFLSG